MIDPMADIARLDKQLKKLAAEITRLHKRQVKMKMERSILQRLFKRSIEAEKAKAPPPIKKPRTRKPAKPLAELTKTEHRRAVVKALEHLERKFDGVERP
jgi:hypothetical protein